MHEMRNFDKFAIWPRKTPTDKNSWKINQSFPMLLVGAYVGFEYLYLKCSIWAGGTSKYNFRSGIPQIYT